MAVSHRMYARSLFQAAQAQGRLTAVHEELGDFAAAIGAVPELRNVLSNPELDARSKADVLGDILGDADELTRNFVLLVAEKGRAGELEEIYRELDRLVAAEEKRLNVELTTAYELSEEEAASILKKIEQASGRSVEATRKVDPSLDRRDRPPGRHAARGRERARPDRAAPARPRQEPLTRRRAVRTLAPFVLLAALVAVATAPRWGDPIPWTPDGLYYEAQTRELEGEEARAARAVVFSSDLAALPRAREQDAPPELRRVGNPGWVEYSAEFYRRRWTVPLAALALRPVAHARSIQIVSLVGYAVFGLTLFALLRRSFGTVASGLAAATILAVPQLYEVALAPLTDTWGLALLAGGMALAVQALRRGRIWLLPFAAVLATLSLTRDNAWVLIGALLLYAVRWRSRRAAGLAALGAAVVLPAHLAVPGGRGAARRLHGQRLPDSVVDERRFHRESLRLGLPRNARESVADSEHAACPRSRA